jgi:hypothetical protein
MMMKYLNQIEPRRVPVFAAGFVLLAAVALVTYLVFPQFKARRAAVRDRAQLEQIVEAGRAISAEHAQLYAEVAQLEADLLEGPGAMREQDLEAFVIGSVQTTAWRRDLELVAIQPAAGARIGTIQETLFQLELAGRYADLHAWLQDLHAELASAIVRELALVPVDDTGADPRLRAAVSMAAYRRTQ